MTADKYVCARTRCGADATRTILCSAEGMDVLIVPTCEVHRQLLERFCSLTFDIQTFLVTQRVAL